MAAHAVGDDKKIVLLEHDERILVVLALEPDVAQPGRDYLHQSDESSNKKRVSPTLEGVKRVMGKAKLPRLQALAPA
jgi:hypothetical protein